MTFPKPRMINSLLFVGTVSLIAAALFMEHAMDLSPCPLCIMQRIMVIAAGLVALSAALHNPAKRGIQIYAGLVMLFAFLGAGLASRQLWLQSLPADLVPACGPSLEYMIDVFPILEVIQMVVVGDGNCAEVAWRFLGVSIPGWALAGFVLLALAALVQILKPT